MPLIVGQKPQKKTYDQKFFHQDLTGSGKKERGLLNSHQNLGAKPDNDTVRNEDLEYKKLETKFNAVKTIFLPLLPIPYPIVSSILYNDQTYLEPMLPKQYIEVGKVPTSDQTIYMSIMPASIRITKAKDTSPTAVKDLVTTVKTVYLIFKVYKDSQNILKRIKHSAITSREDALKFMQKKEPKETIDMKIVEDYIDDLNIVDQLSEQASIWNEDLAILLDSTLAFIKKRSNNNIRLMKDGAITFVENMNNYMLDLEQYTKLFKILETYFKDNDLNSICRLNINLLLAETLASLKAHKSKIPTISPKTNPSPKVNPMFSKAQKDAIMSTEPLIMVQSAAGSGKSTVVLNHIKYMVDSGVAPEDIMVLSFTNAAADNISLKNPGVNSMTITKMINEIYQENFDHQLSTLSTVANTIMIYFKNHPVGSPLASLLNNLALNRSNSFIELTNFVEDNYDEVIKILDKINQTTLELEIIICYSSIDTLKEPQSITSKHLIIDEVQDNSVFEFIYTLKYVNKHLETLFIVGDASQCLYEFRASNPTALNVMENSGIFTTYKLQTNYRSNQEILNFANNLLANIEANQFAKLQLRANNLTKVTKDTFKEKVKIHYEKCRIQKDINDTLPLIIKENLKDYIEEKLNNKEQICLLAFSKVHGLIMQNAIAEKYPDKSIINITSKRVKNITYFSKFICRFWEDTKFYDIDKFIPNVVQGMYTNISYFTYGDQIDNLQDFIRKWLTSEDTTLRNWTKQAKAKNITKDELRQYVRDNMLDFEIKTNAIKQRLLSGKNEDLKDTEGKDFIISTIHGVKGLEFDNVIVLIKNSELNKEDCKRLYYVALTRAIKSEYVIAYDTIKEPVIVSAYNEELEKLV